METGIMSQIVTNVTLYDIQSTQKYKKYLKLTCMLFQILLTTIGGPCYFWKGICTSKAHKPVTLS